MHNPSITGTAAIRVTAASRLNGRRMGRPSFRQVTAAIGFHHPRAPTKAAPQALSDLGLQKEGRPLGDRPSAARRFSALAR
jgi:hypothetical protein